MGCGVDGACKIAGGLNYPTVPKGELNSGLIRKGPNILGLQRTIVPHRAPSWER